MRILVISDSHGRRDRVESIILSQPAAQDIFFLGDVTGDIEDMTHAFANRNFHIVSGNCDFFSQYPHMGVVSLAGKKIFYTHGHNFDVKHGTGRLAQAARQNGCDIALYGHTHVSQTLYDDGLHIVNPGSCSRSRSGRDTYAVIDIEQSGILPIIIGL